MEQKAIQPKNVLVASTKTTLNKIVKESEPLVNSLMSDVQQNGITPNGPLEFIYYGATGDMDKEFDLEIALPVVENDTLKATQFQIKQTNHITCMTHIHKGSIENIVQTYDELFKELQWNKIQPTSEIREVYLNWVDFSSDENITEIQIGIN